MDHFVCRFDKTFIINNEEALWKIMYSLFTEKVLCIAEELTRVQISTFQTLDVGINRPFNAHTFNAFDQHIIENESKPKTPFCRYLGVQRVERHHDRKYSKYLATHWNRIKFVNFSKDCWTD